MAKKKLIPAIERAFVSAFGAAVGGIILGVAWGSLAPVFPEIPNAVWILAGFFGLFTIVATILSAIHYDDEITRMVESIIYPPEPEEILRSLREKEKSP